MAGMAHTQLSSFELALPSWVSELLSIRPSVLATREERMRLAVDLAELNVRNQSGGPFGAALFHSGSGELLAAGVNVVISSQCAMAHAEIMALALAQQFFGTHDLSERAGGAIELVTSAEPCGMCLGALLWSGVGSVVCGATREDSESCGFDEGLHTPSWVEQLAGRGITVVREVLRAEAHEVLKSYARRGGPIYNAERSKSLLVPTRP
jgi:tRNA(Arg) A34 adenosine deaminase TadA